MQVLVKCWQWPWTHQGFSVFWRRWVLGEHLLWQKRAHKKGVLSLSVLLSLVPSISYDSAETSVRWLHLGPHSGNFIPGFLEGFHYSLVSPSTWLCNFGVIGSYVSLRSICLSWKLTQTPESSKKVMWSYKVKQMRSKNVINMFTMARVLVLTYLARHIHCPKHPRHDTVGSRMTWLEKACPDSCLCASRYFWTSQ